MKRLLVGSRSVTGLVVAAIAALCACSPRISTSTAEASPAPIGSLRIEPASPKLGFVKIELVEESEAAAAVVLTGRVTFDEDRTQRVASPIDGRVTLVQVHLGDHVKVGQSVVELNSPTVGQFQAEAQKAKEALTLTEAEYNRAKRLRDSGAGSDKEVFQTEAEYIKAKADLARASAQLRSLGISASDPNVRISVRARVAGTVVERNALVGQEVRADATTPLMTISNLDTVWIQADVYEQDLELVQLGAPVIAYVPAYPDHGFEGSVAHVGDVLDPSSRTVKIRCVVPNPATKLKPEMFAKIELKAASGKRLVVPTSAVLSDSKPPKVIVVTDDSVYSLRTVEIGPEANGKVRVLAGLRAGERLVTHGALYLKSEIEGR